MKNFNTFLASHSLKDFRLRDEPPEDAIDRLADLERRLGIPEAKPEEIEADQGGQA